MARAKLRTHYPALHKARAFTLVEMMVVVLIIATLALMLTPNVINEKVREKTDEAVTMAEKLTPHVEQYFHNYQTFPQTNADAGLPDPEMLIGNFVTHIRVDNGAFHIVLGNKMHDEMHGAIISLRPLYVEGSPLTPIAWACGYAAVPQGMTASGINLTSVERLLLPVRCRR